MGEGPPAILVCGGSVDRTSNAALAQILASDFTVLNFDRRGRGNSGDTLPYAVEREVEDIDALVLEAGGSAFLYGTSSGAALALEAAATGLPIMKLSSGSRRSSSTRAVGPQRTPRRHTGRDPAATHR